MLKQKQRSTVDGFMGNLELAQRLKDTRDICRKLDPEGFLTVTGELRRQLRELMAEYKKPALEIALPIANAMTDTGEGVMAMWLIAAAVEECEGA